jgi:PhoH-like ATPase
MQKYIVIDTNIPLQYPYFLNNLQNCYVIIPFSVLHEIDSFKKDNELGKNARTFARILDELHSNDNMTENDVQVIYMQKPEHTMMENLGGDTVDNVIIAIANNIRNGGNQVEILSNDILVRVKARGISLNASSFTSESFGPISQEIYTGVNEAELDVDSMDLLFKQRYLDIDYIKNYLIYPHMFFILKNYSLNSSAIVKVTADCKRIEVVPDLKETIWGISPRNAEQRMALRLLLDPDIPLVTMSGMAGTGKTLLALAAGLLLTNDETFYKKILLTKPVMPMGKDIGYLPGGKEEKLNPWLQSYFDNLEQLLDEKSQDLEQMRINLEALTYIRGRTLPNQYIIIDEAQNLNKHEVKSIVSRAGEDTKIILMGDPDQIDAPYLDSMNNGLVYVINKFKEENVAGHITLTKGQRSKLATVATQIL